MTREIKFRAWDTQNERYNYGGFWIGGLTACVGLVTGVLSDDEAIVDKKDTDNFIPEQYTGLKDKNGVEIYEGDIVCIQFGDGKECGPIVYDDDRAHFKFQSPDGTLYGISSKDSRNTVIGNIHENPELLEADNGTV